MFGICGGGGGGDRMQGRQGGAKLGIDDAQHRACQRARRRWRVRRPPARRIARFTWPSADGKTGTVTVRPVRRLPQAKFDAIFASLGREMRVHIGPGTYHTKGGASFEVKSFWKIHGAGYEVARIIQDLHREDRMLRLLRPGGRGGDRGPLRRLRFPEPAGGQGQDQGQRLGGRDRRQPTWRAARWFKNYGSPLRLRIPARTSRSSSARPTRTTART